MAKSYYMQFGSGDPRGFTGLLPTFLIYSKADGTSLTRPAITETTVAGSGIYTFSVSPSFSIVFMAWAATTNIATSLQYVSGNLDPGDANDEKIGLITDSFGSTSADPTTIFGYLKRTQEVQEGNASFLKSSGAWSLFSRGSTTLLAVKALTNSSTGVTKI